MTKKPSFFEKLTGARWSENESIEKEKIKPKKTKVKSSKDDSTKTKLKLIKKDFAVGKKNKISSSQKSKEPSLENKQPDEWLTESEGQLTIDVYQTPNEVIIKSTIAGVSPEDIDITMSNDMITIKGSRGKDEEIKEEDYYYQECYWGPFSRSVVLPVDVEVDQVDASMKNGILTVRLPKVEKVKTKKIEIRAE